MTRAIRNLSITDKIKPAILKTAVICVALLFILYVYFLSVAISKAMEGEKILEKISILERQKVELEENYLEAIKNLDMDFARENGFIEAISSMVHVSSQDFLASR